MLNSPAPEEKRDLYFENYLGERIPLTDERLNWDAAWKVMVEYLKEQGFKLYYYRVIEREDGGRCIDFGSHSEFVYWI